MVETTITPASLSQERISEIRDRAEKATPGPLFVIDLRHDVPDFSVGSNDPSKPFLKERRRLAGKGRRWRTMAFREDVLFEAHAHQDVPDLLAHIAYLEQQLEVVTT